MKELPVSHGELFRSLPRLHSRNLEPSIQSLIDRSDRKVIVLDDDPTGTQTVHGVPVITQWSVDDLAAELENRSNVAYVLTNSRSLDTQKAVALNREIARNLRAASSRTGRDFTVVSRCDSTLRGHFPEEMDVLADELGHEIDAWVLCPFFEEGGRFTIGDVHYVAEEERLVPVAQTHFASDAAFGYHNSNLRRWIVERSAGRIPTQRIVSLSIADLRGAGTESLAEKLQSMAVGSIVIVNAACRDDLLAATHALLHAESRGHRFLYRSAASLVAARAGIKPRPLLEKNELASDPRSGSQGKGVLVVVGSHVPKTTAQLARLRQRPGCAAFELEVDRVLNDSTRDTAIAEVAQQAAAQLDADTDGPVVVFTSRDVADKERHESLVAGRSISQALVDVVRAIRVRPRVLIAKGGITSSDVATEACGIRRAIVMGQIHPGVPVWRCGPESRWPGMPLVVFPGNVGGNDALADVVARVSGP